MFDTEVTLQSIKTHDKHKLTLQLRINSVGYSSVHWPETSPNDLAVLLIAKRCSDVSFVTYGSSCLRPKHVNSY